jgi:hypothetical protein
MAKSDIPAPDQVRDYAQFEPLIRQTANETWFDPDWLWNFVKGMQDAGLPTERTLAALQRQHVANKLTGGKRLFRFFHLRLIGGYWGY